MLRSSALMLLSPSFGTKNNYTDTDYTLLNVKAPTLPLAVSVIPPSLFRPRGSSLCSRGYWECVLWTSEIYLLLICLNPVNQMDSGWDVNVSLNRKSSRTLFHTDFCDWLTLSCCKCFAAHITEMLIQGFFFVPQVMCWHGAQHWNWFLSELFSFQNAPSHVRSLA